MPIFIIISRHTPESCPVHNEVERKRSLEAFERMGEFAKKYEIKVLGDYAVMPEHTEYLILEGPNESFHRSMTEPYMVEYLSHYATDIKTATSVAEAMQQMKMM